MGFLFFTRAARGLCAVTSYAIAIVYTQYIHLIIFCQQKTAPLFSFHPFFIELITMSNMALIFLISSALPTLSPPFRHIFTNHYVLRNSFYKRVELHRKGHSIKSDLLIIVFHCTHLYDPVIFLKSQIPMKSSANASWHLLSP